jgi:spore coat protein A
LPEFDGYPEAWFTNAETNANPPYYRDYVYPNDQPATNLWFHDHAIGTTRLNVYAGLIGDYFLRDDYELSLGEQGLPINAPYEIPLIFMDRWLALDANNNCTGRMLYDCPARPPRAFSNANASLHHPTWATEVWADTMLVNGKAWPYLEVEPRLYRFRTLNACNARFLNISFHDESEKENIPFAVIGTDQGFLPKPVRLTHLLKGNAERHDILVDFSKAEGKLINMRNVMRNISNPGVIATTPAPYPSGDWKTSPCLDSIMQFRVREREREEEDTRTRFRIPSTLVVAGFSLAQSR